MPFAINDSTKFISPTKTPEYLAGGRPVVSTPITDVIRHYGDLEVGVHRRRRRGLHQGLRGRRSPSSAAATNG